MGNYLSLLKESLVIMVLGMFVVFVFIEIMILLIKISQLLINKFSKKIETKVNIDSNKNIISTNKKEENRLNSEIVSAIFSVIKKYEKEKI